MEKLTKNRMIYLLAHYEGVVAQMRHGAGDGKGAAFLFESAINKYEHLASINEGEEQMALLNEALKLAQRSENNVKTYRLHSMMSKLIIDPEAKMTYVEIKPGRIRETMIRDAILRTYSNHVLNNSSYIYRVELDREGFNRLVALLDDSELGKLIVDSKGRWVGEGGIQVPDGKVIGITFKFDYNYSGYLGISSSHVAYQHQYVKNVINVYGTALDGIISGLSGVESPK